VTSRLAGVARYSIALGTTSSVPVAIPRRLIKRSCEGGTGLRGVGGAWEDVVAMETKLILPATARQTIERLLARRFGVGVRIARVERFWPASVWRCGLEGGRGEVPETVVVRLPRDSGSSRAGTAGLACEHAALTFLGEAGCTVAPGYIAGGAAAGALVSEDLGPHPSLLDLLLGSDPEPARQGLMGFARALGMLHRQTLGRAGEYRERLGHAADGVYQVVGSTDGQLLTDSWQKVRAMAGELGRGPGRDVDADVEAVQEVLADTTGWALSSGDPSVANCTVAQVGVRLLDFEGARFRHAFLDATVLRYPYPTGAPGWRLPERIVTEAEREYRIAMGDGSRDGGVYETAMAAACVAWTILRMERLRKVDEGPDRDAWLLLPAGWLGSPPVRSRRRQLVSTMEAGVAAARRAGVLAAWAGWCDGMLEVLDHRWPETREARERYPAFV
jgi:hypothetical protein